MRTTYNRTSKFDYQASNVDPLSQVIGLLKPQALGWNLFEAHDVWSLRFPPVDFVVFGQVIEGACEAVLRDSASFTVKAGDFLLLSAPGAWTVSAQGGRSPVELKDLFDDPALLMSTEKDPVVTRFIAGAFGFATPAAYLLSGLIPPLVHVRGADVAAGRLGALLNILGGEALSDRPGRSLVLERLLEIILVEALRHGSPEFRSGRQGLLAGLADPKICAALHSIHRDARRPWTVASLAREAGMSRSSFAARFAKTVGAPPIDYVSNWRMSLAKVALTSSSKPMSEIAELAGYGSVSAFSTAFSRGAGRSPSSYGRAAGQKAGRLAAAR